MSRNTTPAPSAPANSSSTAASIAPAHSGVDQLAQRAPLQLISDFAASWYSCPWRIPPGAVRQDGPRVVYISPDECAFSLFHNSRDTTS